MSTFSLHETSMQHILNDLESQLRHTADHLRQFSMNNEPGNDVHNHTCGNDSPGPLSDGVVAPLEALQQHVETCEAAIARRLHVLREEIDLAANISREYQRRYPGHHAKLCAASAASSPCGLPPAEYHLPISGGTCQEDVKAYLAGFVRWDPHEFDREALSCPHGSASHGLGSTHAAAARPMRRSLNAVVDDLVVRQLQHDGVQLTTSMEMELGCYERMTAAGSVDARPGDDDVAVPQELRRGMTEGSALAGAYTDLLHMVRATFPRTLQWLAQFVSPTDAARTPDEAMAVFDGGLHDCPAVLQRPTFAQDSLRKHAGLEHSGFSAMSAPPEPRLGASAVQGSESEQSPSFSSMITAFLATPMRGRRHTPTWLALNTLAAQVMADDEDDDDNNNDNEEEEQEEEEGEGDDEDYEIGLEEEDVHEVDDDEDDDDGDDHSGDDDDDNDGGNDGEEEENDDDMLFVDAGNNMPSACVEDDADDDNANDDGEGPRLLRNVFTQSASATATRATPTRAAKVTGGAAGIEENEDRVRLAAFAAQRAWILLSDLAIICALQRFARMIETSIHTNHDNALNNHSPSDGCEDEHKDTVSATLHEAVELTLSLRRDALIKWRLDVECDVAPGAPRLLLTFRHVLVALGYIPIALDNKNDNGQLLQCVAPFLCLWGCGGLVEIPQKENGSSNALPSYTAPLVWRDGVLADLLDQAHKLNQLEPFVLPFAPPSVSSPDALLRRFVYPFGTAMLRRLDEYGAKGLLCAMSDEAPIASQQENNSDTVIGTYSSSRYVHTTPAGGAPPGVLSFFRSRGRNAARDEPGTVTIAFNPNNNSNNNSNNSATASRLAARQHRKTAVMLDLPHASAILSQYDDRLLRATPSLLYPKENAVFAARAPVSFEDTSFVWQPLFHKTMCYCPVTHGRCMDAVVCSTQPVNRGRRSHVHTAGFNPPQLLLCGHVISHRALMTILERPPHSRAISISVRCPYCNVETPSEQEVMLRCLY